MVKKPVKERIKLTPLKVKTIVRDQQKGAIPVIEVEGTYPTQYNEAAAIVADAGDLMADLKAVMLPDATTEVYRNNSESPWALIKSAKLKDANANVTRITLVDKFAAVAAPLVEAFFGALKKKDGKPANVNDYMARQIVAKWDSKVFQDATGKFDSVRYAKFSAAVQAVAIELGVASPLSTEEVVQPLPGFSTRRWLDFDLDTNVAIGKVLVQEVQAVPCPNAAECAVPKS